MDRENVIRALENCTDKIKCRDCPWEPCDDFDYTHSEYPDGLIKDALELLKEDEKRIADYQRWHENQKNTIKELLNAQKQIVPQERNGNYFCYCGNRLHKIVETDKFCSRCGRAVKWDG